MNRLLPVVFGAVLVLGLTAGPASARSDNGTSHTDASSPSLPAAVSRKLAQISAAHIGAHARFLASGLPGQQTAPGPGGSIAAAYIATQFALAGLKPDGDHGSYLQHVKLIHVVTDDGTQLSLTPAGGSAIALKRGSDYLVTDQTGEKQIDISQTPIVFVGYGLDTPQHNDYRNTNVNDKIVLILPGLPKAMAAAGTLPAGRSIQADASSKFALAAQQGALGAILIQPATARSKTSKALWSAQLRAANRGHDFLTDNHASRLHAALRIQRDVADLIFNASQQTLESATAAANSPGFKAHTLPIRLSGQIISSTTPVSSSNIIGRLPGSSATTNPNAAPEQVVVYTAQYNPLVPDNSNTPPPALAMRNASAVGSLIELARVAASMPVAPRHKMLFVATENDGQQLGARYLSQHLPTPAKRLALVLDFSATPSAGGTGSLSLNDASGLESTVEQLEKTLHLKLARGGKSLPAAAHVFAQLGVPTLALHNRTPTGTPGPTQTGQQHPLLQTAGAADWQDNAQLARFALALGWRVSLQVPSEHPIPGTAARPLPASGTSVD